MRNKLTKYPTPAKGNFRHGYFGTPNPNRNAFYTTWPLEKVESYHAERAGDAWMQLTGFLWWCRRVSVDWRRCFQTKPVHAYDPEQKKKRINSSWYWIDQAVVNVTTSSRIHLFFFTQALVHALQADGWKLNKSLETDSFVISNLRWL